MVDGEASVLRGDDTTSWATAAANTPLIAGDAVFAGPVNEGLMHLAVKQYLAGLRAGTHKTKTRAEVSGDLQHAKVYVSIMGTEKEQQLTMHGLRHAAGFIQSKLADRLQTRFTPDYSVGNNIAIRAV